MLNSENVAQDLAAQVGAENVRANERLARYTTWRVGGAAALVCVAPTAAALRGCVERLRAAVLPWLVIGRGSNVLVDDAGIDAVIVVNRSSALTIDGTSVRAESGVLLSVLARRTVGAGLVGLEWCHDIPGTVGGGVVNNAGANGGAMADVLRGACLSMPDGAAQHMDASGFRFAYRRSILRAEEPVPAWSRPVVLEARFELQHGQVDDVKKRMAAQRERRKATQPGGASAGSVFKNPPGDSAGRLIESVGLKGFTYGGAAVSSLHANFIVNGPRATASDVLALVALMRRRVYERYGVELEPEVQFAYCDGRIGPPRLEDS